MFAEKQVNSLNALGRNHVVRFPPGTMAILKPTLLTNPANSGIAGQYGDLAVVSENYGLAFPFGKGCKSGGAASRISLTAQGIPQVPAPNLKLTLTDAPALAVTMMLAGTTQAVIPVFSCILVTPVRFAFPGTTTDVKGTMSFPLPIPNNPALLGAELIWQAVNIPTTGPLEFSTGLLLHLGK